MQAEAGEGMAAEDRARLEAAIAEAEAETGLQIAAYVGPVEGDPGFAAEQFFLEAGVMSRPSVLLLVEPEQRRLEIRTAPSARERLTDREAEVVVRAMREHLRKGDLVEGVVEGLHMIAELVGPARPGDEPGEDLPNLLG